MFTKIKIILAVTVLAITSFVPHASADTGLSSENFLPQCGDVSLISWDWGASLKAISTPTAWTDFDYDSSSYTILHLADPFADGTVNNHNRFKIYASDGSTPLVFQRNSGVPTLTTKNNYIRQANIQSEAKEVPEYSQSSNQYVVSAGTTFSSVAMGIYSGVPDATKFDCEVVAKNVTYAPSWGYAPFNSNVLHGSAVVGQCKNLDVACYVTKAMQGVQNTITSGVSALLNVLGNWFIPDTAVLDSKIEDLQTNLNAHLGFLTYPPTFLVDFYDAFDSSSSWCNDTSCTKYIGTIFGSPWTLDLGAVKTVTPTLWSFMTALVRGMTVLAIVFMLRRKFLEVTNR